MHHQQQSVSKNELFDFVCGESRNFFAYEKKSWGKWKLSKAWSFVADNYIQEVFTPACSKSLCVWRGVQVCSVL